MRSIKPVPLMLVIGAITLGAFGHWLGSRTSATADRPASSGVHISRATVQQINDLLRLYGIPVVLSTSARMVRGSQRGAAACVVSERDTLIISLSVAG